MKQIFVMAMAASAILSASAYLAAEAKGEKVLLIAREGKTPDLEFMIKEEVNVMKDLLEQAGFEVVVASGSGRAFADGKETLEPDSKLSDVDVADYAGFILPCMAVGSQEEPVPPDPAAVAIVKKAVAEGKPVAAQFGGVDTLAKAGVLSGKKYAYFSKEWAVATPGLKDGIYAGNGVVQDGKIVTSAVCPYMRRERGVQDGTVELTKALIAELSN